MKRNFGCNQVDHQLSRRGFLAGTAAGAMGLSALHSSEASEQLETTQKRVLQIFLQGGVSQLESWDPKPGTLYGGPFRAIPTAVPGIRISELLPHVAKRMDRLSIIRGLNIRVNDHAKGRLIMERGRRAGTYPFLGSVASRYLGRDDAPLPGYIHISTRGLAGDTSAFLGGRYGELKLLGAKAPANLVRPKGDDDAAVSRRDELRLRLNARFAGSRKKAFTETYNASYDQAEKLIVRRGLFEAEPESAELARYGKHDFARNCILARNLLEEGATCVKVTHHGYDSHAENFNFHLEQLGEFDRPFCMLLDDLADRGMLESTLVMIFSEFGRTPKINVRYGRDHWGTAWSVALGGCGIKPGVVVGKTNDKGTEVVDREVDGGHVFHTALQAVGVDTTQDHDLPGRSIPIGDPAMEPIGELLA